MSDEYTNISVDDLAKEIPDKKTADEKQKYVEQNIWEKLEKVGSKFSFTKDIVALFKYMTDGSVKWYRKSIVIAALLYFITPLDTIPDFAPFIGYLDDMGVIVAVLRFLGSELVPYYDE